MVFNAGTPGKAKLKSPSGSISTTMPTYTWEAVSGATWYQLIVSDSANANKIKQWYKAADAGCASGTGNCSVTPATALAQGQCMWWIITYNEAGEGPQSDGMSFTVSSSTELTTNTWAGVWSCKEPRYAAMTMTIAGQGMSSQITAVYPDPATEKYTITQVDLLTASGTDEWHCPSCGNPGVWYGTWRISISGNMFYLTRWDNISSWVGYYNCTRK